ncbi:anti-sigma regulatory factor [Opitutus sp. GAS368]|uniref:anti-sigma regulatory factor n=1 Tax=Opitutus sp. GAS368 TaxID=1882749 RepID=UPI00087D5A83|nr:anti-sigma regulatory factor [Opitutus sp. GAS368]SDS41220.1 serine/threonine-protein kinase RsbT [Opitutus sp. GAS368]
MPNPPNNEARVEVRSTIDIVTARQQGRELALSLGFSGAEVTLVAAAISEIARNILDHAKRGEVLFSQVQHGNHRGLQVIAQDQGPGIPDIGVAMQYGYSTRRGLGVGLPGAKWLMDDFEITSKVGEGTKVVMRKWLKNETNKLNPPG